MEYKTYLFNHKLKLLFIAIILPFIMLSCKDDNAYADADKETVIVAKVIAAEACGEGEVGMRGVANVIANRSKAWRETPYEVVTAKNQFYGYTASNRDRLYSECRKTADWLADHLFRIPDITHGALFFRQPKERIRPWHGEETVRIKNHIFHLGR